MLAYVRWSRRRCDDKSFGRCFGCRLIFQQKWIVVFVSCKWEIELCSLIQIRDLAAGRINNSIRITYRNRIVRGSRRLYCKLADSRPRAMYILASHKRSYSVCSSKARKVSLDFRESKKRRKQAHIIQRTVRYGEIFADLYTYLCPFRIEFTVEWASVWLMTG